MSTETYRNLQVINGEALSEAIAELADQLGPQSGSAFALIAALWKGLPAEAVDGIVHLAATKAGPVDHRAVFASYKYVGG